MRVSTIISNRNDTSMLIVTIRSLVEELLPLGDDQFEIIIADNSDLPIYTYLLTCIPQNLIDSGVVKIFHLDFPSLFTAREEAIARASAPIIACLDGHCLVGRGSMLDLLNFMENEASEKVAFAHAPVNWLHNPDSRARHDRDMSQNELGDWGVVHEKNGPMSWKGMPWMVRKEVWTAIKGYGTLAKERMAWGGGDMHIGIKPWLLGYENWAVATRPVYHIGPFPRPADRKLKLDHTYRLYSNCGRFPVGFGFLVSCYILGGEAMMQRNEHLVGTRFKAYIKPEAWHQRAMAIGKEEHDWLRENEVMTFEELKESQPWLRS